MERASEDNMKEEDCFLFSHLAALLMDFKTYFAVEALKDQCVGFSGI